jgi:phosphatidylserine/phosphatidylglycerophosphate/cardiolipin synthase-like enzyme
MRAKKYKKIKPKRAVQLGITLLVFLFLTWNAASQTPDPFAKSSPEPQFYFSQCDDALCPVVAAAINQAQKSILLYIYSLTDPKIIAALEKKALAGVDVTLIEDPQLRSKHPPLQGVKSVHLPTRGLMHRKILVVDEEKVLIGSANFTKDSLYLDDNLITSITSKELSKLIYNMQTGLFQAGENQIAFYPLPEAKLESFEAIQSLLRSAKKTIRVAMFTLTHPVLVEEMIQAKNRGVDVEVAVDRKSADGGPSQNAAQALLKEGVKVYLNTGGHTFHHKFLYLDQSVFAFGSANWTKAAFSKNEECILIQTRLTQNQIEKIEQLWHAVRCEGTLMKPTHIIKKSVVDLLNEKKRVATDFSHQSGRLTQLLFNEKVRVLESQGEWLYVEALEQPHYSEALGWHSYRGYLHIDDVTEVKKDLPPTHAVVKPWSTLVDTKTSLSYGTLLHVEGSTVRLADGSSGTIDPEHLRPLSAAFDPAALISDAEQFLGWPYLWGGRGAYGQSLTSSLDCSGLINLIYRTQGIDIPRDAHPQALKCTQIEKKDLQTGDLIFLTPFDKQKVTHVMLYKNEELIIESPMTGQLVRAFSAKTHIRAEGPYICIQGREKPYKPMYGSFIKTLCV